MLEEPAFTIEPLGEEFARVIDEPGLQESATRQDAVRAAADLLTDGVKRHRMAADIEAAVVGDGLVPGDTVVPTEPSRPSRGAQHRRPTP